MHAPARTTRARAHFPPHTIYDRASAPWAPHHWVATRAGSAGGAPARVAPVVGIAALGGRGLRKPQLPQLSWDLGGSSESVLFTIENAAPARLGKQ